MIVCRVETTICVWSCKEFWRGFKDAKVCPLCHCCQGLRSARIRHAKSSGALGSSVVQSRCQLVGSSQLCPSLCTATATPVASRLSVISVDALHCLKLVIDTTDAFCWTRLLPSCWTLMLPYVLYC